MKKIIAIIIVLLSAVLLSACKMDNALFVPASTPTQEDWYYQQFIREWSDTIVLLENSRVRIESGEDWVVTTGMCLDGPKYETNLTVTKSSEGLDVFHNTIVGKFSILAEGEGREKFQMLLELAACGNEKMVWYETNNNPGWITGNFVAPIP